MAHLVKKHGRTKNKWAAQKARIPGFLIRLKQNTNASTHRQHWVHGTCSLHDIKQRLFQIQVILHLNASNFEMNQIHWLTVGTKRIPKNCFNTTVTEVTRNLILPWYSPRLAGWLYNLWQPLPQTFQDTSILKLRVKYRYMSILFLSARLFPLGDAQFPFLIFLRSRRMKFLLPQLLFYYSRHIKDKKEVGSQKWYNILG